MLNMFRFTEKKLADSLRKMVLYDDVISNCFGR